MRVTGVGDMGVWCSGCIVENIAFAGIGSESEFREALREYQEGGQVIGYDFEGARFNPLGEEEREVLKELNETLRGCEFTTGTSLGERKKQASQERGCSLSLLFHNIRSARGPGLELFESELRRWGVQWDVVGLAETWLDEISEKHLSVQGFSSLCASRKTKAGGGVAFLVRDGLTYRERTDLNVFKEGIIESLFIEIIRGEGKRNEILGVAYRPPGGDIHVYSEEMTRLFAKLRGGNAYIMGDFNIDLLKTDSHRPTTDWLECLYAGGFFPLISLPTRLTDSSATLIDNILTNNLQEQIVSGLITVRVSDHLPIYGFVNGEEGKGSGQNRDDWKRIINQGRISRFAEDLRAWNFDEVRALGAEANVARFRNEFRDKYDTAFPWAKGKKKKKDIEKPWLDNAEFKLLLEEKGMLFTKKVKGKLDSQGNERLSEVCKLVNSARRRLKRQYFEERMEDIKGDLRATWEVLGELLRGRKVKRNESACRYFLKDGVGITGGDQIAQGFCDFYCRVGPELAAKIKGEEPGAFMNYMGDRVSDELYWCPTTRWEIETLCKNLKPGKSAGWDGVSPSVIKAVAAEIAGPLSQLFNCCMREGHYPTGFKVSRVVPVFKAEDPTLFSNYRPVSILPVLSQIFERVIYARLSSFFEKHNVITPSQYGFRAGHSTTMAIQDMVEKVRGAWEEKKVALGVFIDLKKAFDTVDHEILLEKLNFYGVRGEAIKLLKSYLSRRLQYVCYDGFESERGLIECGVPQGSVLGPLFFLIYVNDMVRACSDLELVLFADDTNAFAKGSNPAELFQKVNRDLCKLSKWFRCNKLTLNLKKTEYIYFGGPGGQCIPLEGLTIGGQSIERVEGVRFLGVWVDEGLRWKGQIERVRAKVGRLLGIVGRAASVMGGKAIHMLYNALVLPHLQYCLMAWGDFQGNRNVTLGESLLRLQKRFAGIIAGKKGKFHSDPIMAQRGILKIEDLYRQQMRIYAWKFWNGILPPSQTEMLCKVSETHKHNTRSAKLGLTISNQNHRSIGYRIPKEWGSLTDTQRETRSLTGFKKQSKGEFLSKYGEFKCAARNCFVCQGTRAMETSRSAEHV